MWNQWDHMWGMGPGGWGLGLFTLFLLWALLVSAIIALWRLAFPCRSQARRLLEERYARGEISREEYLQKRGDLGP